MSAEIAGAQAAHAIATFSELGIGVSIAILADLPKWRARIRSDNNDVVKREGVKSAARAAGLIYLGAFYIVDWLRFLLWYAIPATSLFLGYIALHELAKDSYPTTQHLCFLWSLWSFWISTAAAIIIAAASSSADKETSIKTEPIR